MLGVALRVGAGLIIMNNRNPSAIDANALGRRELNASVICNCILDLEWWHERWLAVWQ